MGRPQAPTSDYTPSTLPSDQHLVRLGAPQGSNAFISFDSQGVERLVEMPPRLRRVVHASRGCYAIIKIFPADPSDPSSGAAESSQTGSSRLVAEITSIVLPSEMKAWKKSGEWPKEFEDDVPTKSTLEDAAEGSENDLPPNPNRRKARPRADTESESESSEEE